LELAYRFKCSFKGLKRERWVNGVHLVVILIEQNWPRFTFAHNSYYSIRLSILLTYYLIMVYMYICTTSPGRVGKGIEVFPGNRNSWKTFPRNIGPRKIYRTVFREVWTPGRVIYLEVQGSDRFIEQFSGNTGHGGELQNCFLEIQEYLLMDFLENRTRKIEILNNLQTNNSCRWHIGFYI